MTVRLVHKVVEEVREEVLQGYTGSVRTDILIFKI